MNKWNVKDEIKMRTRNGFAKSCMYRVPTAKETQERLIKMSQTEGIGQAQIDTATGTGPIEQERKERRIIDKDNYVSEYEINRENTRRVV